MSGPAAPASANNLIRAVLAHRAKVERFTERSEDGAVLRDWAEVATDVPVLLDWADVRQPDDATWTAEQRRESHRVARLTCLPTAPIEPGDRVTLTRPAGLGSFEVLPAPSLLTTLHGPSHRELAVQATP